MVLGPTHQGFNSVWLNELAKLDANPVNGLLGGIDSLAYYVAELERHFHSYSKVFGSTAGVAPGLQTSLVGFRVTSAAAGSPTFGLWVAIFNGTETPVLPTSMYFDPHRITVDGVQFNNKYYRLRLAFSEGATYANAAAAVAGGAYTDITLQLTNDVNRQGVPITIQARRQLKQSKIWAALATADAVAQWLDFTIEIHEYEG
jgi:hypothetical protein